jgi:hypothetical protein
MPDDTPAHSYQTGVDIASLASNAEVTVYPWREPPELKERSIDRMRTFLKTHQPVTPSPLSPGGFGALPILAQPAARKPVLRLRLEIVGVVALRATGSRARQRGGLSMRRVSRPVVMRDHSCRRP